MQSSEKRVIQKIFKKIKTDFKCLSHRIENVELKSFNHLTTKESKVQCKFLIQIRTTHSNSTNIQDKKHTLI